MGIEVLGSDRGLALALLLEQFKEDEALKRHMDFVSDPSQLLGHSFR